MSNLDNLIERELEKQIAERAPGAVERVIARLLGGDAKPVAPTAVTVVNIQNTATKKPAKRRAQVAAAKTVKAKTPAAPAAKRSGPMPGSVADQVLSAITAKPHTEAELGELLAAIDATDEAKRQAVARLAKSGRVVVATERNTRIYRLGAASDPSKGE